jgi:hypothetical protein
MNFNIMSPDPALGLLLEAAKRGQPREEDVIMEELSHLPVTNNLETSPCMMQDVGNYLTKTTTLLSELAQRLVHGEAVQSYAIRRIQEAEEIHDLSELDSIQYLHEKHAALR